MNDITIGLGELLGSFWIMILFGMFIHFGFSLGDEKGDDNGEQ